MLPLTEKYRPSRLSEIVGQDAAVMALSRFAAKPCSQAFVLAGGTGLGKTAAAFALANELGCDMRPNCYGTGGLYQIAAGDQKVDNVRDCNRLLHNIPMYGSGWKVLVVNEADQSSPQTQVAWLDILEDLPPHSVVVFTTNELRELSARFQDRCMILNFVAGSNGEYIRAAETLISRIWTAERPGEAVPSIRDFPEFQSGAVISYRRVVQAVAKRLLDPAPFIPAPVEVVAETFFAPPPKRQTVKPSIPARKPYQFMSPQERKAVDAEFLASRAVAVA